MKRKYFPAYLKQVMKDNNWIEAELARQLNTSRQNVNNWVSGKTEMPLNKFILLNEVINNKVILPFTFEQE